MVEGLVRIGGVFEFPFLAGAMLFAFILPQLPGLAVDSYLPEGAFARAMAVAVTCALACRIGWSRDARPPPVLVGFSERRLVIAATILSLAGAYFFFKFNRLPYEILSTTPYTGITVVYLFFGKLLYYGFAIALLCLVRRFSPITLAVVLFDSLFYLDRIVLAGRRAETVQFMMTFALALWFLHRWTVPRTMVLAGLLVGTVILGSAGDYRGRMMGQDGPLWAELTNIDVVENFQTLMTAGGEEMRNAVNLIEMAERTGNFDFGLFHWNTIVFTFVPSQFVGNRFKDSLYIPLPGSRDRDYVPQQGSTETGFADAFTSFWYLGAVKFLLVSAMMGYLYSGAMAGRTECQIAYMLLIVPAMHTISHHTHFVVSELLQMLLFVGPALLWARICVAPSVRWRSGEPNSVC